MNLATAPTKQHNSGMASFLLTIIILGIGLTIVLTITFAVKQQQTIISQNYAASQAFFTAEAGVEDAMLRIRKNLPIPGTHYNLTLNNSQTTITIGNALGGSRTITSQGAKNETTRKVQAVNSLSGDNVQFNFGAQVGAGGLTTSNNSQILGNVFANGDITGSGAIKGNVIISGNNKLQNVSVQKDVTNQGGDVQAYLCDHASIAGKFYYPPDGSQSSCTISGGSQALAEPIDPAPLPISASQINDWKTAAAAGGIYNGDYSLGNNQTRTIGPLKIQGDLIFSSNNTLNLTGTVWVTGNIITGNNATIQLANTVYGNQSGVLVFDGTTNLANNCVIKGTGQAGSYLMLLTTNSANPAMSISNNTQTGIFYASNGYINMANNSAVKEVTAYGLNLSNNVTVTYETGLANIFFTSGPGAGWKLSSWQEIP